MVDTGAANLHLHQSYPKPNGASIMPNFKFLFMRKAHDQENPPNG